MRTRVDSYIRLFERLLDTVAEAPKGNQLVEACLASESGKSLRACWPKPVAASQLTCAMPQACSRP